MAIPRSHETVRSTPSALFTPEVGELPPWDAVELYFETPASVGLLHMESVLAGRQDWANAVEAAREAAVAAALDCLYGFALLKVGDHAPQRVPGLTVGEYLPGEIRMTRVPHLLAVDAHDHVHDDVARLHDHVYLGKTGRDRRTDRWWPVDLHSVQRGAKSMRARYNAALHRSLTSSMDVAWSSRDAGEITSELVEPPLAEFVDDYPRVICRENTGQAEYWNVQDLAHPRNFSPDRS